MNIPLLFCFKDKESNVFSVDRGRIATLGGSMLDLFHSQGGKKIMSRRETESGHRDQEKVKKAAPLQSIAAQR
jgi:hypothetical protein